MLGQSTNRLASIAIAILITTSMAATPALANHDDNSFISSFSGDTDDNSRIANATAFVSGFLDRAKYAAGSMNPFAESDTTADQHARDVQTYFNNNNQSFIGYANNRSAGGTNYQVWKLTFEKDGTSETVYLVADYNTTSDAYTSAEVVNTTDRTVDETVTLEGYAAANAREELEYFHSNYVIDDKPVDTKYTRRLAGKYAGSVESSILDEGSDE